VTVTPAGLVGLVSGVGLGLLASRRLLLIAAAREPAAERPVRRELESLTVLVPARDEAPLLDRLFGGLEALDYPDSRLFIVLVDDGSTDTTGQRLDEWSTGRPHTVVVHLPASVGKPQALNEAIAAAPSSGLIGICDADLRPHPDCFRRLAEPFADEDVGAVVGLRRPANATATLTSRYAAIETWVHQLITATAKDRLDLNPPSLGLCVYRRSALDEVGWFSRTGAEDTDSSLALTRAGWRTRFVAAAVGESLVVSRPRDFWSQRLRWTGHLLDASRSRRRTRSERGARTPLRRRIEATFVSAAYLDRVLLCGAAAAAAAGAIPVWVPAGYLGLRGMEVLVALQKAGVRRQAPGFLLAAAVFLPIDLVAASVSFVAYPWRERRGWRSPRAPHGLHATPDSDESA
jgi:GT2 family glycosyltransferase